MIVIMITLTTYFLLGVIPLSAGDYDQNDKDLHSQLVVLEYGNYYIQF